MARIAFLEVMEPRLLLSGGGPLTLTITELGTSPLETVTITSSTVNSSGDSVINYTTPTTSPFADFSITGLQVTSNRTQGTTPGYALLGQAGTISRTTTTGGSQTLEIKVEDYQFLYPASPSVLMNSASVSYNYGVVGDLSSFQSVYNDTTPSPIVALNSIGGRQDSEAGSSTPTPLTGVAPFNLSDDFQITLAPSGAAAGVEPHLGQVREYDGHDPRHRHQRLGHGERLPRQQLR